MTTLLALDTATEACSVALLHQGQVISRYEVIPRLHAQSLLPMVQEVLSQAGIELADVDAIAYGRGPGAFTGIRIAIGVVQGLGFAAQKPVIGISNLAAIAQRAYREAGASCVAAAIDARMDEVYWGLYALDGGEMRLIGQESVCPPEHASLSQEPSWYGAGTGFGAYAERLPKVSGQSADLLPHALDILTLAAFAWARGEAHAAEQAQPTYLRDKVATPKGAA